MPIVTGMLPAPQNERRLLGGAVRRIRELSHLTLDELSTKAEIHYAYLSKIERGLSNPSLAVMFRLANALAVDVEDISYMATVYVITDDERVPA